MKNTYEVDALCVEVFSRISAAVSHEIKNTLSIINENAGLLSDLALMAGEDGGVPTGHLQELLLYRGTLRLSEIVTGSE